MTLLVAVVTFVTIAMVHTVGGERDLITPLVADTRWRVPDIDRRPAELLLRGAWHMTTIAWIALAAAALGADPVVALAVTALLSGLVLLVFMPGHPAWPLFGLVAVLAGHHAGMPRTVLLGIVLAAATVAVAAAALHLLWAAGRAQQSMRAALPDSVDGASAFSPPPLLTALVATLLVAYAALLAVGARLDSVWVDAAVIGAGAVLVVRAIGDRDQAGLSKTNRTTSFARRDERTYTPLVVLLAFGSLATLLA